MPTTYIDQFYVMDPANPPARNTFLQVQEFQIVDFNDNNFIESPGFDSIDGVDVTAVWPGDRVRMRIDGQNVWIEGTTFYLADGRAVFTPTDGTILQDGRFRDSDFVTVEDPMPIGDLGPPCLMAGTLVDTDRGRVPVEQLREGDRVMTLDHGPQPLLWLGVTTVPGLEAHAPVVIDAGALGNSETLRVSPQHRVLVGGWQVELIHGAPEVLVAAKHLVNGTTIRTAPARRVVYYHLLFERHEIIRTGGVWTESFLPEAGLERDVPAMHDALARMHPELAERMRGAPLARPQLRHFEAALLAA
ncbi:Hint domain-containing protein [Roseicyclus persicicus]|uniref:Hint domain-containing protein n=1 Tax=Roseicyclus persicicus TaxID=2650661 RepID=A0A7X6GZB0_9RHOB|nr:Hint domain-containing protein [Roseibacterium persicicum]NKX45136.1 Hint domain-containing protein [Roseibacterium persicicum]